ncbi:MAG: Zn-dependent hydrolase [Actinomycetota bacterium]
MTVATIDVSRLGQRLDALAEIGRIDGPNGEWGNARLALTDEDRAGRDLVVDWMRALDLDVTIDRIGNIVGVRAGRGADLAPVMTGSHIDTVGTGGRFDGTLGVLAGLEVIEALNDADIVTERPLAVAVFTDEEGSRFPPDMLGSLVYAGGMPLEAALAIEAVDNQATIGDELGRIGYAGPGPCPPLQPPHAFVELHIEQGPVLEAEGIEIGVVTDVQGISWTEVSIVGRSAHAGTTPMAMRRDPGFAAGAIATFVRDLTRRIGPPLVATVGRVELVPNLVNVVPARATLTVDMRHTDDAQLAAADALLTTYLEELAVAEQVEIATRSLASFGSVRFDPSMVERIASSAERLGYSHRRMVSGAGHDAQMLARICPSSMIFVPSVDGLSHNIAEYTKPEHLEAGTAVLLDVLLDLASM